MIELITPRSCGPTSEEATLFEDYLCDVERTDGHVPASGVAFYDADGTIIQANIAHRATPAALSVAMNETRGLTSGEHMLNEATILTILDQYGHHLRRDVSTHCVERCMTIDLQARF